MTQKIDSGWKPRQFSIKIGQKWPFSVRNPRGRHFKIFSDQVFSVYISTKFRIRCNIQSSNRTGAIPTATFQNWESAEYTTYKYFISTNIPLEVNRRVRFVILPDGIDRARPITIISLYKMTVYWPGSYFQQGRMLVEPLDFESDLERTGPSMKTQVNHFVLLCVCYLIRLFHFESQSACSWSFLLVYRRNTASKLTRWSWLRRGAQIVAEAPSRRSWWVWSSSKRFLKTPSAAMRVWPQRISSNQAGWVLSKQRWSWRLFQSLLWRVSLGKLVRKRRNGKSSWFFLHIFSLIKWKREVAWLNMSFCKNET